MHKESNLGSLFFESTTKAVKLLADKSLPFFRLDDPIDGPLQYLQQMDFKSHLKASVYMVVPSLYKLKNSSCSWDLINTTAPI